MRKNTNIDERIAQAQAQIAKLEDIKWLLGEMQEFRQSKFQKPVKDENGEWVTGEDGLFIHEDLTFEPDTYEYQNYAFNYDKATYERRKALFDDMVSTLLSI